jgi:hypothetical protein
MLFQLILIKELSEKHKKSNSFNVLENDLDSMNETNMKNGGLSVDKTPQNVQKETQQTNTPKSSQDL